MNTPLSFPWYTVEERLLIRRIFRNSYEKVVVKLVEWYLGTVSITAWGLSGVLTILVLTRSRWLIAERFENCVVLIRDLRVAGTPRLLFGS